VSWMFWKRKQRKTARARLIRHYRGVDCTLGTLFINEKEFCKTLELPYKANQKSISCIPEGFYYCKRITSPRFGDAFHIIDVPERSHILFHEGNTVRATRGCILVGSKFGTIRDMKAVLNSVKTNNKMLDYFDKGSSFTLDIL